MGDIIDEIKTHIGYTTKPSNRCKSCVFSSEHEGFDDRSWVTKCNIASGLVSFSVDENARCNNWQDDAKKAAQ